MLNFNLFRLSFCQILTFIFLITASVCFSQNETNNWYFGKNAGLNFDNGAVTVLENGGMQTPAGCASVSDDNGNLLFYTNGKTVWNKNHQIMQNGADLFGEIEGVQSAIIIPKPNDTSIYYIFYTRDVVQSEPFYALSGIFYSEVKIEPQNPLGFVTTNKNVQIAEVNSTTRIAAIHHPESNSVRVVGITKPEAVFGTIIADGQYVFRIFNVSESGINLTPTIRSINFSIGRLGAMKISPDSNYLAFADAGNQKVYFYNFDNTTINFQHYFTLPTVPAFGLFIDPYGIEFSQDSKMFYYSGGNNVVQFPFTAIGGSEPAESYIIPVSNAASIQLARNGKIYVAQGNFNSPIAHLAVINNPEKLAEECNFRAAGVQFPNASSTKGLPIFIASSLRSRIIPSEDDCVNIPFTFKLDAYTIIQSVVWDFGDGVTTTDFNPTHTFSTPGIKKVKATIVLNNRSVVLYKDVEAYPLPYLESNQILSQCDVDNDGISVFNLENIKDYASNAIEYQFYHNSIDANADINPIPDPKFYTNTLNPEVIFVKMISENGCVTISNFLLENYQPNTQPIRDYYVCENSDTILNNSEGNFDLEAIENDIRNEFVLSSNFFVKFYGTLIDAQTKINELDSSYKTTTTVIWVRIEDENYNCFGVIPFNAIVNSNIDLNVDDLYTICDLSVQPPVIIDGGNTNDSWEWKNETGATVSNQRFFQPVQLGNYSLTVSRQENGIVCSATKNFIVKGVTVPEFLELKAENGKVFIAVKGSSIYEFSMDGITYFGAGTSYTFEGVSAGTHTVYVKDIENCEKRISKDIYMLIIQNFFTPNNDSYNDVWKIEGLSEKFYSSAEIVIYDRYGRLLHKMNLQENQVGWSGIYNKKELPASDYWYKITLIDLKKKVAVKSGHFTLKR